MGQSGSRGIPVNDDLIREWPRLQSRGQRTTSAVLKFAGWCVWIYLWYPLIALIAWLTGCKYVADYLLFPDSWDYLYSLLYYVCAAMLLGLCVVGWSYYNLKRYGHRKLRKAPDPATPELLSTFFKVEPATIIKTQKLKSVTFHLADDGQFDHCDIPTVEAANRPNLYISAFGLDMEAARNELNRVIWDLDCNPIHSVYQTSAPRRVEKIALKETQRLVRDQSDMMVLIVGEMVGSVAKAEGPITRFEYLTAKEAGIPVCIFLKQAIYDALPAQAVTKAEDHDFTLEPFAVLPFVQSISNDENVWVRGFNTIRDIEHVLDLEMDRIFYQAFSVRYEKNTVLQESPPAQMDCQSLRLATEKPAAWEIRLFCRMFRREIEISRLERLDQRHAMPDTTAKMLDEMQTVRIIKRMIRLMDKLQLLLEEIVEYVEPGYAGKIREDREGAVIVYLAGRLGKLYREMEHETGNGLTLEIPEKWKTLAEAVYTISGNLCTHMESLVDKSMEAPVFSIRSDARIHSPVYHYIQQISGELEMFERKQVLSRLREVL
jgi:biofilm PGA synthesis protein PgaD